MQAQLNIALQAGRKAAEFILNHADRLDRHQIEQKSANDFVTQIDKKSEAIIIDTINKAYPEHNILAEESGALSRSDSEYQWIIDPLDGTTNFIFGIPHYAVSIALLVKGRLEVGVIIDVTKRDEFTARRGDGAMLNGRRIRVSDRKNLTNSILATGIPFGENAKQTIAKEQFSIMEALCVHTAGIRRMGAAALDMAYVAAGRYDGYWEAGINAWDVAAGALLVQEAGGLVGDYRGGLDYLKSRNIVAGSPKIFKALLQQIGKTSASEALVKQP